MTIPEVKHLEELIEFGEIGHVRRIHDKLEEIERISPEHSAFVEQMRAFVKAFDLKRYLAVLKAIRNSHA
jgi:hypothetical protein